MGGIGSRGHQDSVVEGPPVLIAARGDRHVGQAVHNRPAVDADEGSRCAFWAGEAPGGLCRLLDSERGLGGREGLELGSHRRQQPLEALRLEEPHRVVLKANVECADHLESQHGSLNSVAAPGRLPALLGGLALLLAWPAARGVAASREEVADGGLEEVGEVGHKNGTEAGPEGLRSGEEEQRAGGGGGPVRGGGGPLHEAEEQRLEAGLRQLHHEGHERGEDALVELVLAGEVEALPAEVHHGQQQREGVPAVGGGGSSVGGLHHAAHHRHQCLHRPLPRPEGGLQLPGEAPEQQPRRDILCHQAAEAGCLLGQKGLLPPPPAAACRAPVGEEGRAEQGRQQLRELRCEEGRQGAAQEGAKRRHHGGGLERHLLGAWPALLVVALLPAVLGAVTGPGPLLRLLQQPHRRRKGLQQRRGEGRQQRDKAHSKATSHPACRDEGAAADRRVLAAGEHRHKAAGDALHLRGVAAPKGLRHCAEGE
mmetsp:Transcript_3257/g.9286  ORF Transcript_3257/g.9286 Transcript_3257/m.9286 type:complete len:482 (-) Transcript_3257:1260-2705(-)